MEKKENISDVQKIVLEQEEEIRLQEIEEAFDLWIKENSNGGIFIYQDIKIKVTKK